MNALLQAALSRLKALAQSLSPVSLTLGVALGYLGKPLIQLVVDAVLALVKLIAKV